MEREVDLCLLGVRHDSVELLIESALLHEEEEHQPNELVFFEYRIAETRHHRNLENDMIATMQYMFSLIVLHLAPQTTFVELGHNDDETERRESFQQYAEKWRLPLKFFLAMSDTDRRLFLVASFFYQSAIAFIQRTGAESVFSELSDFFGQNKAASEAFSALLLAMLRDLKSNNALYVRLNDTTMERIHRFARDICDLFVVYEGRLGGDLDVVATLLRDFTQTGRIQEDFITRITLAGANVRDRLSMDRVVATLQKRPNVKRVILVIGYLHTGNMLALLRDYDDVRFRVTSLISEKEAVGWTPRQQSNRVLSEVEKWRASSSGETS